MADLLVVDDDRTVRQILIDLFRAHGHAVAEAGNGAEALNRARRDRFDVIFLDIAMPVLNGIDTLRHLRQVCPRTPVIMISGLDDQALAAQSMDLGAFDFVCKPFDLSYLEKVVLTKLAVAV